MARKRDTNGRVERVEIPARIVRIEAIIHDQD